MLKTVHRLPSFVRLPRATLLRSSLFTLKYQRTDNPVSRASVVISKKVSPKATERNRLKRLVHTVFAQSLPEWKQPIDVLILLRPESVKASEEEFVMAVTDTLSRLTF